MSDSKGIRYVIDAEDGPFADVMRRVNGTLKDTDTAVTGLFGNLAGPFGKVLGLLGAITGVLAGGAVFRASVEASKDFTVEATKMGTALDISATEASTLAIALGDVYAESETFTAGAAKLAKELRTNEDGLRAMGLQTRDSSGNLRNMKDLMLDSIEIVNGYAAGTDRTIAAQKFFGKGAEEMRAVLKLTNEVLEEAKRKQQELGLIVGVENVESTKRYRAAMNRRASRSNRSCSAMPAFRRSSLASTAGGPPPTILASLVAETVRDRAHRWRAGPSSSDAIAFRGCRRNCSKVRPVSTNRQATNTSP